MCKCVCACFVSLDVYGGNEMVQMLTGNEEVKPSDNGDYSRGPGGGVVSVSVVAGPRFVVGSLFQFTSRLPIQH